MHGLKQTSWSDSDSYGEFTSGADVQKRRIDSYQSKAQGYGVVGQYGNLHMTQDELWIMQISGQGLTSQRSTKRT